MYVYVHMCFSLLVSHAAVFLHAANVKCHDVVWKKVIMCHYVPLCVKMNCEKEFPQGDNK